MTGAPKVPPPGLLDAGPPPATPVRADLVPDKPKPSSADRAKASKDKAHRILARAAPRAARNMVDLMAEMRPAHPLHPPCPTCGCGMPRPDDVRLRAILAVADRAGVVPAKAADAIDLGPALILPPGTKVALVAEVPSGEEGVSMPSGGVGLRLTRADRVADSGDGADPLGDVGDPL